MARSIQADAATTPRQAKLTEPDHQAFQAVTWPTQRPPHHGAARDGPATPPAYLKASLPCLTSEAYRGWLFSGWPKSLLTVQTALGGWPKG